MAQITGLFRLGRDAELRFTQAGEPVASLALAFNYGQKGQDGNRPTQWVEAALWGKRAEALAPHLTKGTAIVAYIEEPHVETYQKKDGSQGVKLVGRVANLEFAGGGQQQTQGQQSQPRPQSSGSNYQAARDGSRPAAPPPSDFTDDIPW